MKNYSDEELEKLLLDLESDFVERKRDFKGETTKKARQAVCAFANDLPNRNKPGVLFIGANDDGSPANLPITDELLQSLADMKTDGNILPLPVMTVEKRVLQGAEMAVVTVQPSDTPPVRYDGRIWIRTGPRRTLANEQDERILNEKRRYKNVPFDIRPFPPAKLSDLDKTAFGEYLRSAIASDVLEANNRTYEERLSSCKMIVSADDPTPTVLGLLTLGISTQDFLPGAYIQFLRIDGSELGNPIIDEETITGSIVQLIHRILDKLNAHNRVSIDIVSDVTETRKYDYPQAALQQLVYNAVLHRNYEGTNSPIRIYWYNDRIEIQSPGGPYGNVTEENFGQPGVVDYRNPNLAEVLRNCGFIQKFGYGIQTARKELEHNGNPALEFEVNKYFTLIKVKRRISKTTPMNPIPTMTPATHLTKKAVPILTLFNNKGEIGKTSILYHLAYMFAELGKRVVAVDLDPQSNFTAAFLSEQDIEKLWQDKESTSTIYQAVKPLISVKDLKEPNLKEVLPNLYLLPGDVGLSSYEEVLSEVWPSSMGETSLYRPMRILSSFWQVMQLAAQKVDADIILVDIGPNLGAINRSVLISTDYVMIPLGADLFSLQGLRNLGPMLKDWKKLWKKRLENWKDSREVADYENVSFPEGKMEVIGYICQQYGVRQDRPVQDYEKWMKRIPVEYRKWMLQSEDAAPESPANDDYCLYNIKHYRSLIPMAQEARKPIFKLTAADGAIGGHATAVKTAKEDFEILAKKIAKLMNMKID
jgi:ATP-dependent DNA helicase RecG